MPARLAAALFQDREPHDMNSVVRSTPCLVCGHLVERTDTPWDTTWRCTGPNGPCHCVMIGCVPS